MSNSTRSTLYVGVTNDITRRTFEHKTGTAGKFSTRYKTTDLIYYEAIYGMLNAIKREKQLKNWHREWKLNLIKENNPLLKDLSEEWYSPKDILDYKNMLKRDSETSSE